MSVQPGWDGGIFKKFTLNRSLYLICFHLIIHIPYQAYEWVLHKAQQLEWSEDSAKALVMIGDAIPQAPSYTDQKTNWHTELDVLKGMGVKVWTIILLKNLTLRKRDQNEWRGQSTFYSLREKAIIAYPWKEVITYVNLGWGRGEECQSTWRGLTAFHCPCELSIVGHQSWGLGGWKASERAKHRVATSKI